MRAPHALWPFSLMQQRDPDQVELLLTDRPPVNLQHPLSSSSLPDANTRFLNGISNGNRSTNDKFSFDRPRSSSSSQHHPLPVPSPDTLYGFWGGIPNGNSRTNNKLAFDGMHPSPSSAACQLLNASCNGEYGADCKPINELLPEITKQEYKGSDESSSYFVNGRRIDETVILEQEEQQHQQQLQQNQNHNMPIFSAASQIVATPNIYQGLAETSRTGIPIVSMANSQKRTLNSPKYLDESAEKRQRRMIKNRESAARSRARKQAYVNHLEKDLAVRKQEIVELLQEKNKLEKEVKVLEEKLSSIQKGTKLIGSAEISKLHPCESWKV